MNVMMRLQGEGFAAIANSFREREKQLGTGLPLLDFVEIVYRGLPHPKTAEEKAACVSALIDVFDDMDVNGDNVVKFDEFTSFCVTAEMIVPRRLGSTMKYRYERDAESSLKTASTLSTKSSNRSMNTGNHLSGIEKLKWSAGFCMFLVLENAARSVKLFTGSGKYVTEVYVATGTSTLAKGSTTGTNPIISDAPLVRDGVASTASRASSSVSIVDAVFIHRFLWLAISTTDLVISFYEMSNSRKTPAASCTTTFALLKHLSLSTPTAQIMLRFCETSALLMGSGNDFVVNIWKLVNAETKVLWRRLSLHTDLVMDVLEIPTHDLFVSCDLGHRIQLWDINDGRPRGTLAAHTRGVRQLCYSKHHDLLLSAGFEFEAFAWDLSSRQVALTLSGHQAPLVGVQLAHFQTERAITGDCQGVFKIWDITRDSANSTATSTCHAVQLESVNLGMPSAHIELTSFVSLSPYSRDLWAVTSGSCTLQRLRSVRVQQFDEVPLRAFYHYSANKFVVVAGSVCSLWDGETGACSEEHAYVGNLGLHTDTRHTDKIKSCSTSSSSSTVPMPSVSKPKALSSTQFQCNGPKAELLICAHDIKCRKLAAISEQGTLAVFNCQNFVPMRQCHESFLSKVHVQRRCSDVNKIASVTSPTPSCNVVGLHYCSNNKLIIVADAGTSAIIVIDDDSNQDSSNGITVLRRLVNIPGGISTSAYNFNASMIATAATEPEGMKISLWDFETLASIATCRYTQDDGVKPSSMSTTDDHSLSIQVLEFWDEFPILLASDSMGGVYFFAVTALPHTCMGNLLHAFANDHRIKAPARSQESSTTIHEHHNEKNKDKGDDDQTNNDKEVDEDAVNSAPTISIDLDMIRRNALTAASIAAPPTSTNRDESPMETSSPVTCLCMVFDEKKDHYLLFVGDERGCIGVWDPAIMIRRLALCKMSEKKRKHLRRGYQPKAMFCRDYHKEKTRGNGKGSATQRNKHRHDVTRNGRREALRDNDVEHVTNVRATQPDLKRLSRHRQENLTSRRAHSSSKLAKSKTSSPPRVKEAAVVNAVAAAEFLMSKGSTFSKPKRQTMQEQSLTQTNVAVQSPASTSWPGSTCYETFPRDVRLLKRWQAHVDAVTSLEISRHPNIVVTCGLDMRVFVWDWDGACLGKLFDPENQGTWPWRFRKNDATRLNEREVLVRQLLRELERTPAEKMELRRQTLYAEHVERHNVKKLDNGNAMLLEHIINKNREIKALELELTTPEGRAETALLRHKTPRIQEVRKSETLQTPALLPVEIMTEVDTLRQSLRLQSLNQVKPVHYSNSPIVTETKDPQSSVEPLDLKMDTTYLENELSIVCPTSSLNKIYPTRKAHVQQQVLMEYKLAQEANATRAKLTRKARAMYSNLEGLRTRHRTHGAPSCDQTDQVDESLEASEFLKRHFPPSALAVRPQTAPGRALTNSSSAPAIRIGCQKASAAFPSQRLQVSASVPLLPSDKNASRVSAIGFNALGASLCVESSLDEFYMEELRRHRLQQQQHKERGLQAGVRENVSLDCDKARLRPLYKLREINNIIDKVHEYCNDALAKPNRQSTRPGTAPVVARYRASSLLSSSIDASEETCNEKMLERNTKMLR